MKNLFFSFSAIALLFVSWMAYSAYTPNIETSLNTIAHHDCHGTSVLGGTCSATCRDAESCACSSGFFECKCTCTSTAIKRTVTPGPIENWEKAAEILSKSGNAKALAMAERMPSVHGLAATDLDKYLLEVEKLEKDLHELPNEVQQSLGQAFMKKN